MAQPQPFVRTVTGDVPPGQLGVTYCHEHLLLRPAERLLGDPPDMLLDDEDRAAEELERFRAAGGGALVECTAPELGRDPAGLRRLSERTGVRVVAVTGHITPEYWDGVVDVGAMSEQTMAEEMRRDLLTGMGATDVRAGAIKIGTARERITPAQHRLIRAAATVQAETGAPITTHTTAGTAALAQARALLGAGADPAHVCVGHLDRRIDPEGHRRLARTGVRLGYDCLGKEQYQPDADRVELIAGLVADGFGDHICLGGDMARRSYLEAWGGGRGYRFILETFVPRLEQAGVSPDAVRRMLRDNPQQHLTWRT